MLDHLASLPDAIGAALDLGVAALRFDPGVFERAADSMRVRELSVLLVFIAGISQGIGHGAVLFLNHVAPWRFALSLGLTGLIYLSGAVVTAVATTVSADMLFRQQIAFEPLFAVLALAHAPRLLGVLTLAPYIGEALERVLDVWVLALLLFGLYHGVDAPFVIGALAAGSGWLAMRGLSLLLGRPLTWLIDGLRWRAAGRPLDLDLKGVVDSLREKARELINRQGDGG